MGTRVSAEAAAIAREAQMRSLLRRLALPM